MKLFNCCVVCYSNVQSLSSPTFNENECVTTRFIKLFERHVSNFSLQSSQINVSSSTLTFLSGKCSNNEPIKLQVCECCSELLSSFNSSYGDLKCAEMKANWSLLQLANVIRFADSALARLAQLRENVNELKEDNRITDDDIEIIGIFRKQLQHQCRTQYKNQFPQVILMEPSVGQTLTQRINNFKNQLDDRRMTVQSIPKIKTTKKDLVLTALINLSSLHLILYLALFDSTVKAKAKTNVFSDNFESNESHEQERLKSLSFGPKLANRSNDHKNHVVDLLSAPPSPSQVCSTDHDNDNDIDGEWDPGDCTERSELDYQEADNVPMSSSSAKAHHICDSSEGTSAGSDMLNKNCTEYRIQIRKFTTHICLHCRLELDSEKELEEHMVTCSITTKLTSVATKMVSNSNFKIKQEPIEISIKTNKTLNTTGLKESLNKPKPSCNQSGKRYNDRSGLRRRKKIHLKPETWKHSCTYCGKKFIQKANMMKHLRTHREEKPFKCPVVNCKSDFSQDIALRRHQKRYHHDVNIGSCLHRPEKTLLEPEAMTDSCNYRGKSISAKQNLTRHVVAHTVEKQFKCPADNCKMAFSQQINLCRHRQKNHENNTDIIIGGKMPYQGKNIGCSGVQLTRRTTYSCPEPLCNMTFRTNGQLRTHKQRVHELKKPEVIEARLRCEVCKETYSRVDNLNRHRLSQHGLPRRDKVAQGKRKNGK